MVRVLSRFGVIMFFRKASFGLVSDRRIKEGMTRISRHKIKTSPDAPRRASRPEPEHRKKSIRKRICPRQSQRPRQHKISASRATRRAIREEVDLSALPRRQHPRSQQNLSVSRYLCDAGTASPTAGARRHRGSRRGLARADARYVSSGRRTRFPIRRQ